jgi:hypothetical protein
MSRIWREKETNPIDPPAGGYERYESFQKIINSNNGAIDNQLLEEHIEFMKADERWTWIEIPVDFRLLCTGCRIRYTAMSNGKYVFRTGGWVMAIAEDYTWFVYRSHTNTSWSVQAADCRRLWMIQPKITRTVKQNKIRFKQPEAEGKFNTYLADENGLRVLVGAFDDVWKQLRFENTSKYLRAKNGERWTF